MAEVNKPRIRIRDAVPSDIDAIVDVHFKAFERSIMSRLMYPGGDTESARKGFGFSLFPKLKSSNEAKDKPKQSGESFLMVAELLPDNDDDARPEIVAYSKWMLHREPRPEEEWSVIKTETAQTLGEGVNVEIFNAFSTGLRTKRRDWAKGDPALFLGTLACNPKYGRLGAASALLQWGVELIDREGIPGWLEASPVAYPLYRRFGYEDVDVHDLDISVWNAVQEDGQDWGSNSAVALAGPLSPGAYRSVLMRRLPKGL